MKIARLLLVFPIITFAACTSSNFTPTGFQAHTRPPLVDTCTVTVLESMPTDRQYEEIGFCNASAPGGGIISDKTPDAIAELKRCACRNGGNVIVFKTADERGIHSMFGYSQQHVSARATVLFVPSVANLKEVNPYSDAVARIGSIVVPGVKITDSAASGANVQIDGVADNAGAIEMLLQKLRSAPSVQEAHPISVSEFGTQKHFRVLVTLR